MKSSRIETRLLLKPESLKPSRDDFEGIGTFNPGAVRVDQEVVLLVRVAEKPRERRAGLIGLPRWVCGKGLTVDWVPEADLEFVDPRVVFCKDDGLLRLTS